MDHFGLSEGVFCVRGASRAAILDTRTTNVYSINQQAARIISCSTASGDSLGYWQKLIEMDLAIRCDFPVMLPELPRQADFNLGFVWFEINGSDCNERCLQCYASSLPKSLQFRKIVLRSRLSFEEWCSLIDQSFGLGCRRGQFIGGEPFLYRQDGKGVLELAEHAKCLGYRKVEIFTNAMLLTRQKVQRIKDLGLEIAVTLYSLDPKIHDQITRTPGSHRKTVAALRLLKEFGVKTRVEVIVMRQNQETVAQTMKFIQRLGLSGKRPDLLRPTGRGTNSLIQPSSEILKRYGLIMEPRFWAKARSLKRNCSGNSCLAGKIVITENGNVLPCIFSREQVVGNVTKQPLREVIWSESLQKIWHTTKDSVLVCKDCEYRYVCSDCRPLSLASAAGRSNYLHAPFPRCTYNPYTGEWGKGLWRVDKHGEPYYEILN